MHMAQLELAKGRAEAAKLTARVAALEEALAAETQRATALEAARDSTRDEAAAAADGGALQAAKLGAAATAQQALSAVTQAERERHHRARRYLSVAACHLDHEHAAACVRDMQVRVLVAPAPQPSEREQLRRHGLLPIYDAQPVSPQLQRDLRPVQRCGVARGHIAGAPRCVKGDPRPVQAAVASRPCVCARCWPGNREGGSHVPRRLGLPFRRLAFTAAALFSASWQID